MRFDNHDARIKYYELLLEGDLDGVPQLPLPEGYRFVFFRPGDRDIWIDIERSAGELTSHAQGVEVWNKYYGGREDSLCRRMVFVENAAGEKVATATAYEDITGRDRSGSGWLHWVAVRREYQGRGLSKPLISYVLGVMRALGQTQTTTWLACKVYLDLGFRPIPQNAVHSRDGWRIVRTLTEHPALAEFPPASLRDILAVWLETERLILRDYVEEDFEAYFRLKSDKKAMDYLQDIQRSSREEAEREFREVLADAASPDRKFYFLHMERKDTGEQVGSIGYTVRETAPQGKLVDAGYFTYPACWTQGYTTEALRRLLAFAFEENGVYRFSTGCLTENRGSERVMQKCGLIKESEKPDWTQHGGKLKTRVEYRLLKPEWTGKQMAEPAMYGEFMRLASERYSVRQFDGRPIEAETVEKILRAGQLVPTACNRQPQRILAISSQEALEKLRRCTECHFDAPAALLVCHDRDECWKRGYDGRSSGDIDAGIAATHLMLAAAALGVGTTWVMHFIPEAVREEFALPDRLEPTALLVMGYPAPDAAPCPAHGQRKELDEVVFYNEF